MATTVAEHRVGRTNVFARRAVLPPQPTWRIADVNPHVELSLQTADMNSVRYRIANPWGLHARPCAFIVSIAVTCGREFEVVAVSARGTEADAKSVVNFDAVRADYGSELEFMSLMPTERWTHFTGSLESLFFVLDHRGNKMNAYDPRDGKWGTGLYEGKWGTGLHVSVE